MKVAGEHYRTVWLKEDDAHVLQIIDQRLLPFEFKIVNLSSVEEIGHAIKAMLVRGAGLIGATAGYGIYIAALHAPSGDMTEFLRFVEDAGRTLIATRPTAVNLEWAVKAQLAAMRNCSSPEAAVEAGRALAQKIADDDAEFCRRIGEHGVALIEEISQRKRGEPVNVLTHCNAGWLAFVDYGSATAPIYAAHARGLPVHVWVDETRPRNQGSRLTAWELGEEGVPHSIVADNTGGHLMQRGLVDLCIVGSDRTTFTGDVANKIGTYLKALAARDNNVPFYVALPSSTCDWTLRDGVRDIPIEERGSDEVHYIDGETADGRIETVRVSPAGSRGVNYAFDVTPARLITGLIMERGICEPREESILALYPEMKSEILVA